MPLPRANCLTGLNYIRVQTGRPWRKRWNGGLDRLKAPTLLELTMST